MMTMDVAGMLSLSPCPLCVCKYVHHAVATTVTQVHHRIRFKRRATLTSDGLPKATRHARNAAAKADPHQQRRTS